MDALRRKRVITGAAVGSCAFLALVIAVAAAARGASSADPQDLVPEKDLEAARPALPAGVPPPSDAAIDLLDLVEVDKDVLAGVWGFQGRALITGAVEYGRLQIPCVPPEQYDLTLVVTRKRGVQSLNLGFAIAGRQAMVAIDANEGQTSALSLAGGSEFFDNETRHDGKVLKWNKKSVVKVFVRKSSVTVTVDERTIIDWSGSAAALAFPPGWSVTNPKALFLGSWDSVFRIDELTLTPREGSATVLRQKRAS